MTRIKSSRCMIKLILKDITFTSSIHSYIIGTNPAVYKAKIKKKMKLTLSQAHNDVFHLMFTLKPFQVNLVSAYDQMF